MIFKDGVMEEIEEIDILNDIIITIKKGPSENILKGIKTYEFRKYITKTKLTRVWVYTGMPVRKIRIYDGNR